jgi:hypothetical protein
VWFTPGTIHRLVNRGGLEILVLMANAGLPEAGDMVITLPADVVADPARYDEVATLPADERTTAGSGEAARQRRDLAVPVFNALAQAIEQGDGEPLRAFHRAAMALVQPRVRGWERIWRAGPLTAASATGDQLEALARGAATHLANASVHALPVPGAERRMGCCGTLGTYVVAG